MPNLTSAPRAALTKANPRARRGRPKRRGDGWWMAIKVAFLVERLRRRREKGGSSPSLRQIALVVVSAGLAILVIRVASQRVRSHGAGPQAETQPETQPAAAEPASTPASTDNDTGLANASSLTNAVQSEMARHDDASTAATGAD
jgi:hypothetical protein